MVSLFQPLSAAQIPFPCFTRSVRRSQMSRKHGRTEDAEAPSAKALKVEPATIKDNMISISGVRYQVDGQVRKFIDDFKAEEGNAEKKVWVESGGDRLAVSVSFTALTEFVVHVDEESFPFQRPAAAAAAAAGAVLPTPLLGMGKIMPTLPSSIVSLHVV